MVVFKFVLLVFIASQSAAHARVLDGERAQSAWDSRRLSVTQDSCKDCTQIFELFVDLISNSDAQERIKNTLDDLCARLPSTQAQKLCLDQITKYLPLVIKFMTAFIKPGEICAMLGLCHDQSQGLDLEFLTNYIAEADMLPRAGTMSEGQSSVQCTFCLYLIKSLESLLPNTKDAIEHFLGQACLLLPNRFRDQCQNFVDKFVPQVLNFLLSWATPQSVCTLLQVCTTEESPGTDCDSCQILAILARFHLGSNATETQTSSFLNSVCLLHPSAIPKCSAFTQHHGQALQRILGKEGAVQDICEGALMCAAKREAGSEGADPCSRAYKCRDMKTAMECNSVSFCQEYMWK